jgi:hypothetical protein
MIPWNFNVLFTFTISLMMLWAVDSKKLNACIKVLAVVVCLVLSLPCDFGIVIPVWVLLFHFMCGENFDFKTKVAAFSVVTFVLVEFLPISFIQHGAVLALIPLYFYSGKRGGKAENKTSNAVSKWGFYVYYPAHILVLFALQQFLWR